MTNKTEVQELKALMLALGVDNADQGRTSFIEMMVNTALDTHKEVKKAEIVALTTALVDTIEKFFNPKDGTMSGDQMLSAANAGMLVAISLRKTLIEATEAALNG